MHGRQGLDGGSLGGIEVPQRDQVIGEGSRLVAGPDVERGDELRLLDQAGLQGEQAEEEVAVGGHEASPWNTVAGRRLPPSGGRSTVVRIGQCSISQTCSADTRRPSLPGRSSGPPSDAYLRLVGDQEFDGRSHFFAAAADAMRRILVDMARRKAALRHGGDRRRVTLDESHRISESPEGLLDIDDALTRFATVEPAKAKLVELRFFAGQSVNEAAAVLGIWPSWIRPWFWINFAQRNKRVADLDALARIEYDQISAREYWWSNLALNFENLSIALLLGLGIGLLCGDLARRLSASLRGDRAATIFWAIVGVLGVMTFVPTEGIVREWATVGVLGEWIFDPKGILHEKVPLFQGIFVPMLDNWKYMRISDADEFVLHIVLKAVFIVGGAALGGLIGALSSREGGPFRGPPRPP